MSRTQGTLPLHSTHDSKEKDPFAATRLEKVTFSDDGLLRGQSFRAETPFYGSALKKIPWWIDDVFFGAILVKHRSSMIQVIGIWLRDSKSFLWRKTKPLTFGCTLKKSLFLDEKFLLEKPGTVCTPTSPPPVGAG